jgi:hypothetical protein
MIVGLKLELMLRAADPKGESNLDTARHVALFAFGLLKISIFFAFPLPVNPTACPLAQPLHRKSSQHGRRHSNSRNRKALPSKATLNQILGVGYADEWPASFFLIRPSHE